MTNQIQICIHKYGQNHNLFQILEKRDFYINGSDLEPGIPYGGYKQSGNGREGGTWGLEEFLEVKTVTECK